MELPINTAGSPTTSRMKWSTTLRLAPTVAERPSTGVRPWPIRSTA